MHSCIGYVRKCILRGDDASTAPQNNLSQGYLYVGTYPTSVHVQFCTYTNVHFLRSFELSLANCLIVFAF